MIMKLLHNMPPGTLSTGQSDNTRGILIQPVQQTWAWQQTIFTPASLITPCAQHLAHVFWCARPLRIIKELWRLPIVGPLQGQSSQQGIPERPISMLIGRMNHESGRLIHHQQIVILIHNMYVSNFHTMKYRRLLAWRQHRQSRTEKTPARPSFAEQ